jgi:hypothetical protein
MRWVIASLALVGLLGASRSYRDEERARVTNPGTALRLLPGGGGQSTVPADFCGLFSSHLVGNHFCLNGDGTQRSGMTDGGTAMQLVDAGSPATDVRPVCPNGPNCGLVTSIRYDGTSTWHETADTPSPAGDVSVGILFSGPVVGGVLIGKDASSPANNRSFALRVTASGQLICEAFKTDASFTQLVAGAGTYTHATHALAVCTYDFNADGTSHLRIYLNGAQVAQNTAAVGPLQTAASSRWRVANRQVAASTYPALVRLAFVTETALDADTILDMARAATGHLSGSYGEAVTFARTSPTSCYDESGQYLTQLPAGRPCVSKGALAGRPAWTNYILRSEEYGTTWNKSAGLDLREDAAIAPDGSKTADNVRKNAAGGAQSLVQRMATGSSGERWTCSVWVSGYGIDTHALGIRNITSSAWPPQTATVVAGPGAVSVASGYVTVTGLSTDGGWTRVATTTTLATDGGNYDLYHYPAGPAAGNVDAGVDLWRSQCSPVAYVPDDCGPTAGTSLACAAGNTTVPTMGWPVAQGEVELVYRPKKATHASEFLFDTRGASSTGGAFMWFDSSGTLYFSVQNGAVPAHLSGGTLSWTPGQRYRLRACWGSSGARLWRDDSPLAIVDAGVSAPDAIGANARIGYSAFNVNHVAGDISDLVIAGACR